MQVELFEENCLQFSLEIIIFFSGFFCVFLNKNFNFRIKILNWPNGPVHQETQNRNSKWKLETFEGFSDVLALRANLVLIYWPFEFLLEMETRKTSNFRIFAEFLHARTDPDLRHGNHTYTHTLKYLQLIKLKTRIFNVPLNTCVFNNFKKSNARRFLPAWAFKWYEARRTEKQFRGSNLVQNFGPC